MWHRFDSSLRAALLWAMNDEAPGKPDVVGTGHLLRSLCSVHGPAVEILAHLGFAPASVTETIDREQTLEHRLADNGSVMTREARDVVDSSYKLALDLHDQFIGSEHLLLAMVRSGKECDAGRLLANLGVTWQACGRSLMAVQRRRVLSPTGVNARSPVARKLSVSVRRQAARVKRLVFGLSCYRSPYLPYQLFRRHVLNDPYPLYARLRRKAPYWDALVQQWVVTRYDDVVAALAKTRLSQRLFAPSAWKQQELAPHVSREFRCLQSGLDRQMLFLDAPDQQRQRSQIARRFTPRVIEEMRCMMQCTAERLLDAVDANGRTEVISQIAIPFPLTVIMTMLDLPDKDMYQCKKWSADYFAYLNFDSSLKQELGAYHSVREATAYFTALIPYRRLYPQRDLLSILLQADENGEYLSEEDVVSNCLLLLATGHENTTRLLGSGLAMLLENPDQLALLREDESLIPAAVEELLRHQSPVQWTLRVLQEDFQWRGADMKKGQWVQIGLAAANRDPTQFADPDRLNVLRSDNRHVAFGHGPHFCLGAALTRLEVQILLSSLIRRFPHLRLDKPPTWLKTGLTFRGVTKLFVRWD